MRLLLIGSTGEIGRRVARTALERFSAGSVTLYVRNEAKLASLLPAELLAKAQVIAAEVNDSEALGKAMAAHGICICTAGNAHKPEEFEVIFKAVVDAAVDKLASPKRLWMMAGVTATDVPSSTLTFNDLPIFSMLPFQVHSRNHLYLQTQAALLDWTLMCPGVLHPRRNSDEKPPELFVNASPICLPAALHYLPRIALSAAILPQMSRFAISLEDVAEAMLDNMEHDGSLSKQRVGIIK